MKVTKYITKGDRYQVILLQEQGKADIVWLKQSHKRKEKLYDLTIEGPLDGGSDEIGPLGSFKRYRGSLNRYEPHIERVIVDIFDTFAMVGG